MHGCVNRKKHDFYLRRRIQHLLTRDGAILFVKRFKYSQRFCKKKYNLINNESIKFTTL